MHIILHHMVIQSYHYSIPHASKDLSSISPTFSPECWPENHTAAWRSLPSQMLAPIACPLWKWIGRISRPMVKPAGGQAITSLGLWHQLGACHDPKACIECSGCNWKVPPQCHVQEANKTKGCLANWKWLASGWSQRPGSSKYFSEHPNTFIFHFL